MSSYGLWLSAAGMQLYEHQQAVLANNIANADTVGFKHDYAVVAERAIENRENAGGVGLSHPVLDDASGGLSVNPTHHDLSQGAIEHTEGNFDLAVNGDGYFTVQHGEEVRYTRDGRFTRNEAGELVMATARGRWRLLDEDGGPIVVDGRERDFSVSDDGTVRVAGEEIGRIALQQPVDEKGFRKAGENTFVLKDTTMEPADGLIQQRALEQSTFEVVRGMVQMIEASRAYSMNATLIQLQDQMSGQAVAGVGRLT
jgi:flagellar basal-body rod protein FlgF